LLATGTIERLPGSGHLQTTDMQFSCRLYSIMLLTEVRDMLLVTHCAAMSLLLSLLAKCKTFNVLYVARGNYLSSMVNPVVAK